MLFPLSSAAALPARVDRTSSGIAWLSGELALMQVKPDLTLVPLCQCEASLPRTEITNKNWYIRA
jgi:hypothetical protein